MSRDITSSDNPRVRLLRSLRDAGNRREEGLLLAEGPVVIAEALEAGRVPVLAAFDPERARLHERLLLALEAAGCDTLVAPPRVIAAISGTLTPQGVAAAFRWAVREFDAPDIPDRGVWVLLDRLRDPGNMGTILRTAHATGAAGVVLSPGCVDPSNGKVVRSAMGSLFRVPIRTGDLVRVLGLFAEAGWHTLCGHLRGGDFYARRKGNGRVALVIGNEAGGASDDVAAACDELVRLPMPGGAASLNAAVAAGVMLYEIMRENGA